LTTALAGPTTLAAMLVVSVDSNSPKMAMEVVAGPPMRLSSSMGSAMTTPAEA
jgi:hypothetical protein